MNILVHTAIAATSLAATVAVAFAGAAILDSGAPVAAAKSDRLEVAADAQAGWDRAGGPFALLAVVVVLLAGLLWLVLRRTARA